jgi:hypothetical protein
MTLQILTKYGNEKIKEKGILFKDFSLIKMIIYYEGLELVLNTNPKSTSKNLEK